MIQRSSGKQIATMSGDPHSFSDLFLGAVTVGERGQVVIPAEAREAYSIQGGDKLLVFHHPWHCGLIIVRVEDVHRMSQATMKLVEEMTSLIDTPADEATDPQ